jgi:hypothetical protein
MATFATSGTLSVIFLIRSPLGVSGSTFSEIGVLTGDGRDGSAFSISICSGDGSRRGCGALLFSRAAEFFLAVIEIGGLTRTGLIVSRIESNRNSGSEEVGGLGTLNSLTSSLGFMPSS